jgi:hypothetical protein
MSDLTLRLQGNKTFIVNNGNTKEIPKESMIELYQMLLSQLSPKRDYSSVSSLTKLFRIIQLECEPDDSDGSEEEPTPSKPVETSKPSAPAKSSANTKTPVKSTPVVKTPAKNVKVPESEDDDDDEDDE